MSLLDNMSTGSSVVKLVGLTAARLLEVAVDDKLTATGSKRLDFKFEYKYNTEKEAGKPAKFITQNTKFSLWIKDTYDVSSKGKVKFIDERGNFADNWLTNDLNDFAVKAKLNERKLNLARTRPAYPGEGVFVNLMKYVIGYRKESKDTIINIDGNEGFLIKDIFNGTDKILNSLNEKLKTSEVKVGVMLGLNEAGYSIVYPNQFEYSSTFDKDMNKLSGEKLEKAKAAIEKSQENFKKIGTRYEKAVKDILTKANDISPLTTDALPELLKYHKESDFYYTDVLTEYTEDLRTSDLAINYELIRNNILTEFNLGVETNSIPTATSSPF